MKLVHLFQQVELFALRASCKHRIVDVANDFRGVHFGVVNVCPLIDARQKAVAPELRTNDRLAGTQHDEAW